MRRLILKLKRTIKRLFKVKEDIDRTASKRPRRLLVKYLMGVVAIFLITFLYPAGNIRGPLDVPREGEIAPRDIIASVTFEIEKDKSELADERLMTIRSTPLHVTYNEDIAKANIKRLNELIRRLERLPSPESAQARRRALDEIARDYPAIPRQQLEQAAADSLERMRIVLDSVLTDDIYYYGVMPDTSVLPKGINSIIVHKNKHDQLMIRNQIISRDSSYSDLNKALNRVNGLSKEDAGLYYQIGRYFIAPNASYDAAATKAAQDSAVAGISPVEQKITQGDLLIQQGTRVDAAKARLLSAYAQEVQKRAAARGWYEASMPIIGRLVLVGSIIMMMYLFFYQFRPDVYWSNNKLFAILIAIGIELFLVNLIGVQLKQSVYLYPIAILSILITVLFDARLGVVVTLLVAILLGILNRFNFTITLITTIAGAVACFSAGEVRRRSEFYRIIIFLSFAYVVIAYVVESLKLSPPGDILMFCGFGLANGFVSPMLTIGLLPMFESVFGFSTNITLLELADLNQPLLKRLAMEAPGTYHHSIIVGNLAEAAAKAINANPLLARVGAYYHDIGKMEIPEYFVENQLGIKSKHESLNPTMSALLLTSHVKKGRLIGEEAGLPDAVLNFIEEHHGTTMMKYFYNKAQEMGLPIDSDEEFRYPGPKPQSKETAIVMLADSTEAASRTLDNPSSARIHNLIQRLINEKFTSGELTECGLTLKDLNLIREAFVAILIGVFHHRIPYPRKEEEEEEVT